MPRRILLALIAAGGFSTGCTVCDSCYDGSPVVEGGYSSGMIADPSQRPGQPPPEALPPVFPLPEEEEYTGPE